MKTLTLILASICILMFASPSHAVMNDWPYAAEVCEAIYKAEGGEHAKWPYGWRVNPPASKEVSRQGCIRLVEKTYEVWFLDKNTEATFLEFLAHIYCPIDGELDNGTCQYWLRNVDWFMWQGSSI